MKNNAPEIVVCEQLRGKKYQPESGRSNQLEFPAMNSALTRLGGKDAIFVTSEEVRRQLLGSDPVLFQELAKPFITSPQEVERRLFGISDPGEFDAFMEAQKAAGNSQRVVVFRDWEVSAGLLQDTKAEWVMLSHDPNDTPAGPARRVKIPGEDTETSGPRVNQKTPNLFSPQSVNREKMWLAQGINLVREEGYLTHDQSKACKELLQVHSSFLQPLMAKFGYALTQKSGPWQRFRRFTSVQAFLPCEKK